MEADDRAGAPWKHILLEIADMATPSYVNTANDLAHALSMLCPSLDLAPCTTGTCNEQTRVVLLARTKTTYVNAQGLSPCSVSNEADARSDAEHMLSRIVVVASKDNSVRNHMYP